MNDLLQAVQNRIWMLLIAMAVDLVIGDPHWLWHPVQGVGLLISASEKLLRGLFRIPPRGGNREESPCGIRETDREKQESGADPAETGAEREATAERSVRLRERAAGALMAVIVVSVSAGLVFALLRLCGSVHPFLRILAEGILCGRLLALRSLGEAGFSVRDPLLQGDVEGARRAVSMIVGRDTQSLDAEGIAKAAVETVAENTSDGVTAPLFYMFLLGGTGGIVYKAVNTMDSMTGYQNDRYRYFGTAAARLDDVLNYIPARLTALCMILICFLPGKTRVPLEEGSQSGGKSDGLPETAQPAEGKDCPHDDLRSAEGAVLIPDGAAAFRVWRRDRRKSPSPNSAQTESVCAGALHLRLLGDTWYFGKLHHKAEIGDGGRSVEPEDITRTVRLMYRTTALMSAAGIAALAAAALLL